MATKPPLIVEVLTDDPDLHDLCERYWDMQGARFRYSVEDIALRHGKTRKEVIKLALQHSRAFRYHCPQCNKPRTYIKGRSILADNPGRDYPNQLCQDCQRAQRQTYVQSPTLKITPSHTTPSQYLPLISQRPEQSSVSAAE